MPAGEAAQAGHTLSDVKVRRVGDTAILSAVVTAKRVDWPGVINNSRRTLTWTRRDGRWHLMHDQWSLVGDAAEAEYWTDYFQGRNQNFNRSPNSLLTQAVAGRQPGKALDVGMGEGRNAIYLAKQGWQVTGIDRAEGRSPWLGSRRTRGRENHPHPPIVRGVRLGPGAMGSGRLALCSRRSWKRGKDPRVAQARRAGGNRGVLAPPGKTGSGAVYQPGELRKMFGEGFDILRYEETEAVADYGQKRMHLVRLIACKTTQTPSNQAAAQAPVERPVGCRIHARRIGRRR